MAARPGFQAGGKELDRGGGFIAFDSERFRQLHPYVAAPGGDAKAAASAKTVTPVTPIGKFAIVLLLFALAIFFLPKGIRGWFVLIIILGALSVNEGAIQEFTGWTLGR